MVTITANEAVETVLTGLAQKTEIRSTSGRVIGYFEPSQEVRKMYEEARKQFDPEELKRIKESGGPSYTTAEVLAHLRSVRQE